MQISMEQFLKLLSGKNLSKVTPISEKLAVKIISQSDFNNYSEDLQTIYSHIFNDHKNVIQLHKVMPFQMRKTKMPLCNKLFSLNQPVYKCFQCFIHEAAVLCTQCFENGHHEGHRFKKFESGGGNCDCGNGLALKKEGFCVNHSGQVQIPEIPQLQQNKYHQIVGTMLKWLFLLQAHNVKFAELYGYTLADYLCKLNKQSVYYNVMTFRVLTKKIEGQDCFLDWIFKLKQQNLAQKFKDLYFQMFSLDQFKVILADKFLNAYNTVLDFQNTAFHSLYIQLFANDPIVLDICNKYKNTFYIQKQSYDYQKYLNDINFMTSIQQEPSFAFFELYLNKNKCIPFQPLNTIEQKLQNQDNEGMHQVDVVSTYINNQNYYYVVSQTILEKIKNNENLLKTFVKGFFDIIQSKKYSFNKNRAVLPFHRSFALSLFTIFKGNIKQMSIKTISQKLQVEQSEVANFYKTSIRKIMNCLLDFAQTFARRNYFDNYIILYARSGVICINYDYLFLKQAAAVYYNEGQNFYEIIEELFSQSLLKFKQNTKSETLEQFIQKWIHFYQILFECGVSDVVQICLNERMQLMNQQIKSKRKIIFKSILKKLGSITKEDLNIIQKYFVFAVNDSFLLQNAQFNKLTKKYTVKQNMNQQIPDFHYEIYISKRKTGQMLLVQQQLQMKPNKQNENNTHLPILNTILSIKNIQNFQQFISENSNQLIELKSRQNVLNNFTNILAKFLMYNSNTKICLQMEKRLKKELKIQQEDQTSNKDETNKLKQELLRKKMLEKKARMQEKQNKVLNKLEAAQSSRKSSQNIQELHCIICRDEQKHNENLCYFSSLKYVKLLDLHQKQSNITNQKRYGFVYSTCFHTAHYSCFKAMYKDSLFFVCPLCKFPCNIMLPAYTEYFNETSQQTLTRIQSLMQIIIPKYQVVPVEAKQRCDLFKSMIQSLVQQIGFIGIFNPSQFDKKIWRVCRQLIRLLRLQWNSFDGYTKEQQYQKIGRQLEKIKTKHTSQRSNIIKSITHCVISNAFLVVQGKQFSTNDVDAIYAKKINSKDLQQLKHNLSLVFNNNQMSMQAEQQNNKQQSKQQNQLKRLSQYLNFYIPPMTVRELIQKRDEITNSSCKTGHSVCLCIECKQVCCIDCKTLQTHKKVHGMESVYFSLLTGGIVFIALKQIKSKSLYENNFGASWTPEKTPQDFTLNQMQYKNITSILLSRSINEYMQKKIGQISQSNINLMNLDDWDIHE